MDFENLLIEELLDGVNTLDEDITHKEKRAWKIIKNTMKFVDKSSVRDSFPEMKDKSDKEIVIFLKNKLDALPEEKKHQLIIARDTKALEMQLTKKQKVLKTLGTVGAGTGTFATGAAASVGGGILTAKSIIDSATGLSGLAVAIPAVAIGGVIAVGGLALTAIITGGVVGAIVGTKTHNAKKRLTMMTQDQIINTLKKDSTLTEDVLEEGRRQKYFDYVHTHINNVKKAYRWLKKYLPEIFENQSKFKTNLTIGKHDLSKYGKTEFNAYSKHFYGNDEEKHDRAGFDNAWNHHQKMNKHHWQYWCITKADGSVTPLDMPFENVIEMICDWWSFSWKSGKLDELFSWYNLNKNSMRLSQKTRLLVENILGKIKNKLTELNNNNTLRESYDEIYYMTESDEVDITGKRYIKRSYDELPNDFTDLDVINAVKDIVYGFKDKNTGEVYDNREWIHNCPNLGDYYATNFNPVITLKNKLGICLDQSLAIKYLMQMLHPSYECKIYALRKGRFGHAVPCYCNDSDEWYYLENAWDKEKGIHGPFNTEEELENYLYGIYHKHHDKDNDEEVTVNEYVQSLTEECFYVSFNDSRPANIMERVSLNESTKSTSAQKQYSEYLIQHISNTKRGFFWICENAPEMLTKCNKKHVENNLIIHDESKYSNEEYNAYSLFFYGPERTPEVKKNFELACQHHFANNPHHPEYWHGLPMPEDYIIEMLCDWWSFSWKDNNIGDIFDFWENKAKNSKSKSINQETKDRIQELLDMLKIALQRENIL